MFILGCKSDTFVWMNLLPFQEQKNLFLMWFIGTNLLGIRTTSSLRHHYTQWETLLDIIPHPKMSFFCCCLTPVPKWNPAIMFLLFDSAICLVLYDKRFGLLQEKVDEEAMNFIAAVKTVSALLILPRGKNQLGSGGFSHPLNLNSWKLKKVKSLDIRHCFTNLLDQHVKVHAKVNLMCLS